MQLKLLYTVIFIFCMSAFASSNGYTRHCGKNIPCKEQVKEQVKAMGTDAGSPLIGQEEIPEYSPFLQSLFI